MSDKPKLVQKKLNDILVIGEAWGAILLLDEVDVFLSKRDSTSLTKECHHFNIPSSTRILSGDHTSYDQQAQ